MIQSITINSRRVTSDVVRFSKKSDAPTSISKSVELNIMLQRMMSGQVVRFCYLKADGITFKVDCGTLQSDSVEANVKGTGAPKRLYGQFAYLSTMSLGWRSFRIENFIGIID